MNPGFLAPSEVISLFPRANLVVAQHGAELTNCLFLHAGASAIEICQPELSASNGTAFMDFYRKATDFATSD